MRIKVLILVLLEVGFWEIKEYANRPYLVVLILVLLEVGFWDLFSFLIVFKAKKS